MDYRSNNILGYRIREARLARGYSLEELAKKMGISRQSLSKYENEDMKIPADTLIFMASVLEFPLGFFSKTKKNDGIGDNPVFFRSLRKAGTKIKDSLSQNVEFLEEIYLYFTQYIHFPKLDIDFSINNNYKIGVPDSYIEEITLKLREQWGLGEKPINNLADLLQRKGIVISRIELDTHNVDAFSNITPQGIPFMILGSDKQSAVRSRMDCAHELGHIIMHSHLTKEKVKENHNILEEEAKKFAGAFLLPGNSFSNDLFSVNLDSFIYLKEKWKVSIAGMIVRAHNLRLITDDQYTYLFKRISAKKWRVKEPLDDVIKFEEPKLLKQAINLLLDNNKLNNDRLLEDLALSQKDIETLCCLEKNFLGKSEKGPILRIIK